MKIWTSAPGLDRRRLDDLPPGGIERDLPQGCSRPERRRTSFVLGKSADLSRDGMKRTLKRYSAPFNSLV